jgi:hypothetical protein
MTFVNKNGEVLLCLIPLEDKKLPPFKLLSRINNIFAVLLIFCNHNQALIKITWTLASSNSILSFTEWVNFISSGSYQQASELQLQQTLTLSYLDLLRSKRSHPTV